MELGRENEETMIDSNYIWKNVYRFVTHKNFEIVPKDGFQFLLYYTGIIEKVHTRYPFHIIHPHPSLSSV